MVVVAEETSLHYEVTGSGPALLVIQAGVSDAGGTAQLVELLARRFTVVTYDRRGLSRSPASTPPPAGAELEQHADDAAALVEALGLGPVRVIGSSIGAVIGLHLLVRAPQALTGLLAHEPPLPGLVRDPVREAALDQIAARAADGDLLGAIGEMGRLTEPDPEIEPAARPAPPVDLLANLRHFFGYEFAAVRAGTLSPGAVAAAAEGRRLCLTGGVRSRGRWEYRCAAELATATGEELRELPGGHNGLVSHPRAVAARIGALVDTELL